MTTWAARRTVFAGTGNTATDTYDAAGRVKTHDDGKGVYTYTYDGTDLLGQRYPNAPQEKRKSPEYSKIKKYLQRRR